MVTLYSGQAMMIAGGEAPKALDSYPDDLDDHVRLYGVRADDFEYTNELCPICDNRIDILGWCGHGNIGGG